MIKTHFKAHPMMIIRIMRPYLFVLVLPLVRAIIQYATKGKISGFLPLELAALGFILFVAVLGWLSVSVIIKDRNITIKKGVLIKTCAVIDLSRLSSISLKQNIFDFIFGSVSCAINTEAGTPQKSDFEIKMHVCDAKRLFKLVYGEQEAKTVKVSAFRIALLAASTSSAATGIIVGVPVINQTSNLIGVAVSDMLIDQISNASATFNTAFPPIVNMVTIVFVIAYGVSFVISFLKNIKFRLKNGKNTIEVQSGLIVQKRIVFKKSKINNICFEQTPLMRMFKRFSMRASVGGYGDSRGEKAVIIPIAKHKELQKQLKLHFPFLQICGITLAPRQNLVSLNRFLYIPALVSLVIFGAAAVFVIIFPYFDRLALFLMVLLLCADLYYASVCYHNYKFGRLNIGEYIVGIGSKGVVIRELYCDKTKIGVIKLSQTPADRRYKTCKIKFIIRSESADSVKIKNLDIKPTVKSLNQTFKINIDE